MSDEKDAPSLVRLRQSLKGVVPPLITPLLTKTSANNEESGKEKYLHQQLDVDVEGTRTLVYNLLEGGVSALFALGSTGECPSLSRRLRRDFVRVVCQAADGKVPVLAGLIGNCAEEIAEDAEYYERVGASALVLTSPCYFRMTSQRDLRRWVLHVVEQVELPVVLYNMPDLTKTNFDVETVLELIEHQQRLSTSSEGGRGNCKIVGIKDSSGDVDYFGRLCREVKLHAKDPDFCILMGPEHLTAKAMSLGADGVVPGGSNAYPKLFVDLHEACLALRNGDTDKKKKEAIEAEVSRLSKCVDALQGIYAVEGLNWFMATKVACELKGILLGSDASQTTIAAAPPFDYGAVTDEQREKAREVLNEVDALLAAR